MKILVVGAGGVGGYFGARLIEAGGDVTFLVRPKRREQLQSEGLIVRSDMGDFARPVRTITAREISPSFDLIILATKAYHLDNDLLSTLSSLKNDTNFVLPLLNGMRHVETLDGVFGKSKVLGGLCRIAVVQDPGGIIRHLGAGHILMVGARSDEGKGVVESFRTLAGNANIDFQVSETIELAMWEKFFTLATLAGVTCLMRAPIGCIASSLEGRAFIADVYSEAASVAHVYGFTPTPAVYVTFLRQLTDPNSELTASILRDLEGGGPIEADHILGDFYRRGRAAGLAMQFFKIIWIHMEAALLRRAKAQAAAKTS